MIKPYIGITDFTSIEEIRRMLGFFKELKKRYDLNRCLQAGVMMSYKTLHEFETKWAKVFPPKEKIASIFGMYDDDLMNCLHYADYDGKTNYIDFARALEYGGPYLDAVQVDMVWPEPGIIAATHESRKPLKVILQVGAQAIEQADNNPKEVVRRLEDYTQVAHYILFDKSMGKGKPMNTQFLLPFIQEIVEANMKFNIAVAGGLHYGNIRELVQPIKDKFRGISIDAQGKLRESGSALDPIDWPIAEKYLAEAAEFFFADEF